MKLLTIINSRERYGSENHMLRVACGLARHGVDVHAAFPRAPGTLTMIADCEKAGVTYWPFDLHSRFGLLPRGLSVSSNVQMLRLLKTAQPDVVQITAGWPTRVWPGALSCAIYNVPLLVVFQTAHEEAFLSPLRLKLLSWARQRRQRWMAVSQQNSILLRKTFGSRSGDMGVLYNGIEIDTGAGELSEAETEALRREVRIELSVPFDTRLLLTTARLSGQKGFGDLLQAVPKIIEQFPDVVFVWAGDGEQRQLLETQVQQRNLQAHVRFLGYRTDISRLLRASDLFVFPSHYEGGCSSAIREAMAHRLPIVCSDAGGIPEVLCNGTHALLFKSRDIHGMLAQLRTALSAPAEMRKLADEARQRIMDFSSERMVNDYFSVLKELKSLPA
jgi:glycosyltransferase involved in cell wall biosynthesis